MKQFRIFFLCLFVFVVFASCGWKEISQSGDFRGEFYYGAIFGEDEGCIVGRQGVTKYYVPNDNVWRSGDSPIGSNHHHLQYDQNAVEKAGEEIYISCGTQGRVMVSRDGGKHWGQSGAEFNYSQRAFCQFLSFPDENVGWVANSRFINQTEDLGDTWDSIDIPEGVKILAVDCVDQNSGFIVDDRFNLYKTVNGGSAWEQLGEICSSEQIPIKNYYGDTSPVAFLRSKGDQMVFALSTKIDGQGRLLVYESGNGGASWLKAEDLDAETGTVYISKNLENITLFIPGKNTIRYFGKS